MLHTDLHSADPEYVNMAQNTNEEVVNGFYRLVTHLPSSDLVMVSSEDQSPRQQPRQCQPGKILELVCLSFKSLLCELLIKQARVKQNGIGACLVSYRMTDVAV